MEAEWVELVLEFGMLLGFEVLRKLSVIGTEGMKMEFVLEFGLELGSFLGFGL